MGWNLRLEHIHGEEFDRVSRIRRNNRKIVIKRAVGVENVADNPVPIPAPSQVTDHSPRTLDSPPHMPGSGPLASYKAASRYEGFLIIVKRTHRVDTQCPSAWQQCGNSGDGDQDSDPA